MDFTEILNWLATVDWVREAIGCFAIGCGMVGKWKLGSHNKIGWLWSFVGSFGWLLFAVRIESPTGFLNNLVYILLSVRGYMVWEKYRVLAAKAEEKVET